MLTPNDFAVVQQLERINADVARDGGATVGPDELRILCPASLSISEQFMRIASIAQKEGCSFAFLPDGTVRFGSYEAACSAAA